MLAIRMQRTGRKGHAMFRMVVQDSKRTPTSGKIVAQLGSYDPHAKTLIVDKDKATHFLTHGAQPSDRAARLLQADGIELPSWVKLVADKERKVRNADKRRATTPAPEPEPVVEAEAPAAQEPVAEEPAATPEVEAPAEAPAEAEAPADEPAV